MVDGRGPRRLPDLRLVDAEELAPVEVPADLLGGGVTPVDDHAVGVETLLAAGAGPGSAAQPVVFMTRPEGPVGITLRQVPAMQGQTPGLPNGVTTQGFGGNPLGGTCPCSVTVPPTRAPVGGCNC